MTSESVVPKPRDTGGGKTRGGLCFWLSMLNFVIRCPQKTIQWSGNCTVIKTFRGQLWETKYHLDLEHQFRGENVFQILTTNIPKKVEKKNLSRQNLLLSGSCLVCVLYEFSNI